MAIQDAYIVPITENTYKTPSQVSSFLWSILLKYSKGFARVKANAKWVKREPRVKKFANLPGVNSRTGKYMKAKKKQSIAMIIKIPKYFIRVVVLRFIWVASFSFSTFSYPQLYILSVRVGSGGWYVGKITCVLFFKVAKVNQLDTFWVHVLPSL